MVVSLLDKSSRSNTPDVTPSRDVASKQKEMERYGIRVTGLGRDRRSILYSCVSLVNRVAREGVGTKAVPERRIPPRDRQG